MSTIVFRTKVTQITKSVEAFIEQIREIESNSIFELDNSHEFYKLIAKEVTDVLFKSVLINLKLKANNSKGILSGSTVNVRVELFLNGLKCFDSNDFIKFSKLLKYKVTDSSLDQVKNLIIYMLSVNSMSYFYDESDGLTNMQKALLLKGMFSSKSRKLSNNFFEFNTWSRDEQDMVDEIIKKLTVKYGIDFLFALLNLRESESGSYVFPSKLALLKPSSSSETDFLIIYEGVEYYFNERKKTIRLAEKKYESILEDDFVDTQNRDWIDTSFVLSAKVFQDPLSYIIQFGIETGKCSFCGLKLEDPTSLLVGYGKTCAEKNDLLWG